VHSGDGNADRIGSFDRRSSGCAGEQASLEENRDEDVQKATRPEEVVAWMARESAGPSGADSRGVVDGKYFLGELVMSPGTVEQPKVVSEAEWIEARKELLLKEKALTRQRDALAEERRKLPWVKVDKNYVFLTASGEKTLGELFGGKSQLVLYHFMLGPEWEQGCPSCSLLGDHLDGMGIHLAVRDVRLMIVSRAPLEKIDAFRKRMGWKFPWVSSYGSEFNFDFGVSVPKEDVGKEVIYNYNLSKFPSDERPGLSVFYKNANGEVFHTYSMYARGLEDLLGVYVILDRVPKGRDEAGLTHGMAWVRHHDRYPESNIVELKSAKG
jgi:predicted dithiol-disulfide oxidoreductase (DUF899 family)